MLSSTQPSPASSPAVDLSRDGPGAGRVAAVAKPGGSAQRIQELIGQVESLPNPAARVLLGECLQAMLELYGQGLDRMLRIVEDSGPEGGEIVDQFGRDEVVRGLLLIHGLHPADLETRLREALEKVRPYMESHGGNVELVGLNEDVARLRLHGTCKSCPSSAVTLELAVRKAIEEACPDLVGFEVEGGADVPGHTR